MQTQNENNNNSFMKMETDVIEIMIKDDISREQLLLDPNFHEYLTVHYQVLAELLLIEDAFNKLMSVDIIRQTIERKQFQDVFEAVKIKKFIPSCDLVVYALLNEKLIDTIEKDEELNQICLKDASIEGLLSLDVDLKQKILNREANAGYILRNENLKDFLLNMNETQCRLERVKRKEGNQPNLFPSMNYNISEVKCFENDVKRSIYALGRNMTIFKERVNHVTNKMENDEKLDIDSEMVSDLKDEEIFSISKKFRYEMDVNRSNESSFNKSNNNIEDFLENPTGICKIFTIPHAREPKGGDVSESTFTEKESAITKDDFLTLQRRTDIAEKENDELRMKNRSLNIEIDKEKSNKKRYEIMLFEKNKELEEGLTTLVDEGKLQLTNSIVEAEIKFRSLEIENENLRNENSFMKIEQDKLCQENAEIFRKVKQFTRALLVEKGIVSQLTSAKADMESSFAKLSLERDNFKNELINQDDKIGKIELTAREAVSKIEFEMRKQQKDYEEAVNQLKDRNLALNTEMACIKAESEARLSDVDKMRNNLHAGHSEIQELQRKLKVVIDDNQASKNEIENIRTHFDEKCKENCIAVETIERMKEDKEKFLSNKYALEREVERLSEELKRVKDDIVESGRRLGDARNNSLETEKMYQNAQNKIVTLQSDLRATESQLSSAEEEKKCLTQRIHKLSDHNKILQTEINDIKQMLIIEENKLKDEKKESTNMKQEVNFLTANIDRMKYDIEILQEALEKEQNLHMSLREQYLVEEGLIPHLQDKIRQYEVHVISLEKRLQEESVQLQQCRSERDRLTDDTKGLYKKLEDYEDLLSKEQIKYKQTLDKIRQDFVNDIDFIKKKKGVLDDNLTSLRDEVGDLREQLRTKDDELRNCHNVIAQLDSAAKGRKELECQLMQSEADFKDMDAASKQLKDEIEREKEKYLQLIQQNDKLRMNVVQLKEGLKVVKEEYTKDVFGLTAELKRMTEVSEEEISSLRESLNKTAADLKATEASLAALTDVGESLRSTNTNLEKTIDALKRRLHQEINNRRLAEQHLESRRHNESRHSLQESLTEDTNRSTRGLTLTKLEQDLANERGQTANLRKQLQTVQTSFYTQEAHIQTLELQLAESHSQVVTLKRKADTTHIKSNDESIDSKQMNDLRKQLILYEKERTIFFQSAQKLAVDLEDARSQLITKTKESIQLSEQCKSLKDKLSELEKNNRIVDDSIRNEIEKREILEHRNHQLEIQNARMRAVTNKMET